MGRLQREAEEQRRRVGSLTPGRQVWHVAFLSGLGLFVELLLIRWLDAQVRPLAYVKNLPLIGSFLGLGIGFALARGRRSLLPLAVPLLAAVLVLGAVMGALPEETAVSGPAGPESNLGVDRAVNPWQLVVFYIVISACFGLVVVATVPLGQVAGAFMSGMPALRAYTANVTGALGGILGFFLLSALSVPPWAGALVSMAGLLAYLGPGALLRSACALLAVGACAAMAAVDHAGPSSTTWSPYNKIEVLPIPPVTTASGREVSPGSVLRVQNLYYQRLLDLRTETVEAVDAVYAYTGHAYYAYNYPFTWRRPGKILVLGAGTGNDVAAALRHGATRVDAVEIDPRIVEFGRRLHPERPYDDPRVNIRVADARAFLKRSGERYDMIVFGLLDAHSSLFSTLSSNIRLDNYVYTVEAFRQAIDRLEPDGVLSLSFYAEQPWIVSRIEAMLREAWRRPPLVTPVFYDAGYLYLVGPGLADPSDRPEVSVGLPDDPRLGEPGPLARDDWPFLYLRESSVPPTVLRASLGVLAVGSVLVFVFFRGRVRFDRHLFFLGAGFLLVETRTIAQLGLLFGATWRVSAITIGSILALILVANLLIERRGALPRPPLYAALGASLLANYFVPPGLALGAGAAAAWAMAAFFLLPLFFAALIFASSVRGRADLAPALASNLAGSVLGGLLENLCMIFGFSALSLVALAVYAGSFRR